MKTTRFMMFGVPESCTKICIFEKAQIVLERTDNWEMPNFQFRAFHSFSVGYCYIQESNWTG